MLSGCLSAPKRVHKEMPEVQREWLANLKGQTELPGQLLDWPEAVAKVRLGNLKLWSARIEVTNAQEEVRAVYRDLLPILSLRSGLSRSLTDIPSTTPGDVTFSADSFINVPGVVGFNARLFAAHLSLLRAQTALALTERTELINLIKVFYAEKDWRERMDEMEAQERAARQWVLLDPVLGQNALTEVALEKSALAKEEDELSEQASTLFGDRSRRWQLTSAGLPSLDYEALSLGDTHRVGQLQMRMAAIELAGARARVQGIKLQYWPELYLSVTAPPLYQQYGNGGQFFQTSAVQANADFFWQIDTRGYVSRQLRQERRSQQLERRQFELESQALIGQLVGAQHVFPEIRGQENQIKRQLNLLAFLPPPANFEDWQREFKTRQKLRREQQKLASERAELETLFWFLDNDNWKF